MSAPGAAAVFRCEATAYALDHARTWRLGVYRTRTARLALRWLRDRATRIADALDPAPGLPWCPPGALSCATGDATEAAETLRAWRDGTAQQDTALAHLADGAVFTLTARDDAAHYVLCATLERGPTARSPWTGRDVSASG
ncbi:MULTISPECIES: hypothetical protein [unclassified Streptomyces]|uniref:hypothetical protein n=1 Tax=unclassified Streptomyces TaxID=2593676 RepID=UPI0022B6E3B9|nr:MULTISPECIES: hypothetical protein [unclassified Streptomyces]MCZ7416902.1 hypothetical protein [Streptomyces sp. WMMC897]MCZ7433281.1 hypothetical protein [Streptomyces sp. WMMC1477]